MYWTYIKVKGEYLQRKSRERCFVHMWDSCTVYWQASMRLEKRQSLIKQSSGTLYWQTSMRLEKCNSWQKKSSGTFARDAGGGESERGTIAGLDEDHIYHHKGFIVNRKWK